ncbi:unnamed protein product [Hymenolepis diminuta]|uniref:Uncharacterized protein n=1 Tax=Hymenolepis diminuta TaxID=6216 RepID=A0A564Z8G3_HYMDI|nr:unnamed protein product [Hymenolepis diminuta]
MSATPFLEAITSPKEKILTEQKYEDVMQQFLQMPLLLVMICAIFVFLLLIIGWISSLVLLNSHYKKKLRKLMQDYEVNPNVHHSSNKQYFSPIRAWDDNHKKSYPFLIPGVNEKPALPMSERSPMSVSTFKDPLGEKAGSSSKSYR